MRCKSFITVLAFAALISGFFVVFGQESDNEVRGAFLSTRPKTTNASTSPRRHRPRRPSVANNNSSGSGSSRKVTSTDKKTSEKESGSAIGLGYTLFMADASGNAVRVDPTREFHSGDRVRVSLEPSIKGYLYIFHSENDGPPEMLFPDMRLEAGDNSIEAHVPFEVPSSEETSERLRWLTFYGNAATERLYIVLTRERLKSVPTGDELVAFCAANKDKCPWHPTAEAWAQVKDATKSDVKVVASKTYGQPQTAMEKDATTRGLGLEESAPAPSVIRMNASTEAPVLVTVLDLIHK